MNVPGFTRRIRRSLNRGTFVGNTKHDSSRQQAQRAAEALASKSDAPWVSLWFTRGEPLSQPRSSLGFASGISSGDTSSQPWVAVVKMIRYPVDRFGLVDWYFRYCDGI